MYSCAFAAVGQIALVDQTNVPSLINIAEEVSAVAFPFIIQQLSGLFLLERSESDPNIAQMTVEVRENGTLRHSVPISVNFDGKPRFRCVVQMGGLVVTEGGTMRFSIHFENEMLAQWNMKVVLIAPQDAGPAT